MGVSERRIDRDAWASLVAELIAAETRGKKAPFARLVKVDPRTIDRWLDAEVNVSEQSVIAVARAVKRSPVDFLVQVGYFQPDELGEPGPLTEEEADEAIQLVRDNPRISWPKKKEIVEYLRDQKEQDRKRRLEAAQWMIRQAEAG